MTLLKRLTVIFVWGLLLLVGCLLTVMVLIPRLTGWVPLTVLSGSMEPTIPTGSLVVVERLQGEGDLAEVAVGDVVTFMPRPQDPTLVTHRVVSIGGRADGSTVLVTKGDANGANDPDPVAAEQARGLVRYHIPYAGHLSTVLNVEQKKHGVIAVAGLLFAYAATRVVRAVRARRQGHPPAAAPADVDT
ncbi:signal peptidase I [Ornithinimicrobium murale]|uniref:signal peptidase I n=1 Tax=Ornithinimicrobium murale TaxID=1050153 RepID=UPI0013B3A44A|nr:signal peptidase I [Ornithinimicrobium murale]